MSNPQNLILAGLRSLKKNIEIRDEVFCTKSDTTEIDELINDISSGKARVIIGKADPDVLAAQAKLRDDRKAAADEALENATFIDLSVTDQGSWEEDGRYWSKKLYGDDTETDKRVCVSFGVEFETHSAKILDTWHQPVA